MMISSPFLRDLRMVQVVLVIFLLRKEARERVLLNLQRHLRLMTKLKLIDLLCLDLAHFQFEFTVIYL